MTIFSTRLAAALCVLIALGPLAAAAETAGHKHAHSHDHAHQAKAKAAKGYFEDSQVKPRELSDWQGEWQSVYPLLTAGTLDPVMAHKAEHSDKTAAEYRAYYESGYKTDVERITIADGKVTFHRADGTVSGQYANDGHEILTYEKGNRGVRFIFRKTGGDAAAPAFIQFSDHIIAPEKAAHYHLYWGENRANILTERTNWPTYYPAALSSTQIVDEMLAH